MKAVKIIMIAILVILLVHLPIISIIKSVSDTSLFDNYLDCIRPLLNGNLNHFYHNLLDLFN